MKFSDMPKMEIELILQTGKPFYINGVKVPQLTLGELIDIGYFKFQLYLDMVTADINKVVTKHFGLPKEILEQERFKGLTPFELYLTHFIPNVVESYVEAWRSVLQDNSIKKFLVDSLEDKKILPILIGGSGVQNIEHELLMEHELAKLDDVYIITKNNYHDLSKVLQYIYYMMDVEEVNIDPSNKAAYEMWLKMKEAKELQQQLLAKQGKEDAIDLPTIISTIRSVHPSMGPYINDMTIYMIYDAFNRLVIDDQYDKDYAAILQGADKVQLKHFSSKIKK